MNFVGFPYAVPLSPAPPIPVPKCTVQSESTVVEDELEKGNKSIEDEEQEKIEHEKLLESLKPLEDEHFFFFEVLVDSIEILEKTAEPLEKTAEPLEKTAEPLEKTEDISALKVSITFETLPNMVISQDENFTSVQGAQEMMAGKVVYEDENIPTEEVEQHTVKQKNKKCGICSLFPMSPLSLIKCFQRNFFEITVYRSNDDEDKPNDVIGQTEFRLDEEFCRCVLQAADIQIATTIPKTLIRQDVYTLKNNKNEDTAKISLMLRLACFGSAIVTRCERKESSNTYIFKNSPLIETFKCQQYKFQNQSVMTSKTIVTKNNKDKCNCMKKSGGFICPEPSETKVCPCVCTCPETSQNQDSSYKTKKQCPFQSNCPFDN